jgi:hypothetical protein
VADDKITVSFNVTGNAQDVLKKLTEAMEDFGKESQKSIQSSTSAFEVFQGVVGGELAIKALESLIETAKELFNVFVVEGIKAAQEQENAINNLNRALNSAGQYSKQTSEDFQEFAASLQQTTKYSDDTIIKSAALIESLGRLSGEGLKRATKDALDLSSALGIDLESASRLVGKAAEGQVSSFRRFGLAIHEGKTEADTFENALKAIESRFGGAAKQEINTFAGAITLLGNTFGDVQKEIGNALVKNQVFVTVVKELNNVLAGIADLFKNNSASIQDFVSNGVLFAIRAIGGFVQSLDVLYRVGTVVIESLKLAFDGLSLAILAIPATFNSTLKSVYNEIVKNAQTSAEGVKNAFVGSNGLTKISEVITQIEGAAKKTFDSVKNGADQTGRAFASARVKVEEFSQAQLKLAEEGKRIAQQLANENPEEQYKKRQDALLAYFAVEQIEYSKQAEIIKATVDDYEKHRQAALVKELEERIAANQLLIDTNDSTNAALIASNNVAIQKILAAESLTAQNRLKINQQLKEQQKKIEQERLDAATSSLGALATLQNSKTKEIAAVGKAAAIAQTIIETYSGAQKAASALAGIPIIGPGLAVAAAAAFVAAGIARVATIAGVPLATGITEVPGGFNNDTFPARLTSGERVVTAEQNKDLTAFLAGNSQMNVYLGAIVDRLDRLENHTIVNIGNKEILNEVRDSLNSGRAL